MNRPLLGLLALAASLSAAASAQCVAAIQKAGSNLKILRSGDLIGDGSREYVAVRMLTKQPKQGMYVSRLVIARAQHGSCSIVLDAGKNGPQNPVGYVGIEFIDDGGGFYGYSVEFSSHDRDHKDKEDLYLTWLNPDHEPEGMGLAIGWNKKVGRYQEYQEESSPEMFKTELANPRHINSRLCGKCPK
ncbi:MAG TPA: hypothetical protein VFT65_05365 [Candidatus Angelobacter sp.]|nr:hypothetical protein [Candidatus Angelobacter sp.]